MGVSKYIKALTEKVKLSNALVRASTVINSMKILNGRRQSDIVISSPESILPSLFQEYKKEEPTPDKNKS